MQLTTFLGHLKEYESKTDCFNPWDDYDQIYDFAPQAPEIRLAHLHEYLSVRMARVKYVLVAEAVGYQGAKFSGVPLTSERMLLDYQKEVKPATILPSGKFRRTSKVGAAPSQTVQKKGFAEPTATIVWQLLQELAVSPLEIILWNMFPFHPFDPRKGRLSNRTPKEGELRVGLGFLNRLTALCPPGICLIALGTKAGNTLGPSWPRVRHPANGGARLFREQLPSLLL